MAEFTTSLEYRICFKVDDFLELDEWFFMMTCKVFSDYEYNRRFQS